MTILWPPFVGWMFFCSLLFRILSRTRVFQDADGQFRGLDKNIEKAGGFTNYTVFSLWDTYRALHPWFNLVHQDVNADIANSMLAHYDKSVEKMCADMVFLWQ